MESMQNTYNYTRRCEQTVTMHVECWQSQNSEDVVPTCLDSNCVWCFFIALLVSTRCLGSSLERADIISRHLCIFLCIYIHIYIYVNWILGYIVPFPFSLVSRFPAPVASPTPEN